jgi:hypothetical protein
MRLLWVWRGCFHGQGVAARVKKCEQAKSWSFLTGRVSLNSSQNIMAKLHFRFARIAKSEKSTLPIELL